MIRAEDRLAGVEIKKLGTMWHVTRWSREVNKKGETMGESGVYPTLLEALSYASCDTYSAEDIQNFIRGEK